MIAAAAHTMDVKSLHNVRYWRPRWMHVFDKGQKNKPPDKRQAKTKLHIGCGSHAHQIQQQIPKLGKVTQKPELE